MPTPAEVRSIAQARYLKEIHTVAQQTYKNKIEASKYYPFPIDPQSRIILDVQLDDATWKRIYRAERGIREEQTIEADDLNRFKEEFKAKLGHPIQETTTVSLDLQTESEQAADPILSRYLNLYFRSNAEKILTAYQGLAKGRIISLHQEAHFHAHLIGRMLKTAVAQGEDKELRKKREEVFGDTNTQLQKGLEEALLIINTTVLRLQAQALQNAYAKALTKKGFDQEKFAITLNEELDHARKELLPKIAKTIRTEVIKATGIQFDERITRHLSRHLAEATSASANDFVHIDKGTGFISFIGASERTSHHQELGEHLADRMMYSHHLQEEGDVIPLSHRQQVRVPSVAVKNLHPITQQLLQQEVDQKVKVGPKEIPAVFTRIDALDLKGVLSAKEKMQIVAEYQRINDFLDKWSKKDEPYYTSETIQWAFDNVIVNDTINKLKYLQTRYHLGGDSRTTEDSKLPHAFIYNLYTTLNKDNIAGRYDEGNNKQSQSAEHILAAAHFYNRQNPGKPLCLVQNIAVNGWGHELSIDDDNPALVNEVAVMMHMASLHTIYESLQPSEQVKVQRLFDAYNKFLTTTKGTSFYNYLVSNNKLDTLKTLREKLEILPSEDSTQFEDVKKHRTAFSKNARAALASLFKEGAFGSHENGFTYQALSVFVEQSSIGGCKSANERAQAVNGRVSILDFVSLDKKTRDTLLTKFLSTEKANELIALADKLEKSIFERNRTQIIQNMDALYGSLNLEGFQAVISFIDQGGHAKLGTRVLNWDTNYTETVTTHVDKASAWQCHKGLTENVLKEFCGIKPISYSKEAKALGASAFGGGAALGAALVFPPVGIAVGIAIGAVAGLTALVAVISMAYKAITADSKTKARFAEIQKNNEGLVNEGREINLEKDLENGNRQLRLLNQVDDLSRDRGSSLSQADQTPPPDQVSIHLNQSVDLSRSANLERAVADSTSGHPLPVLKRILQQGGTQESDLEDGPDIQAVQKK